MLSRLEEIRALRGAALLDVGSAYGWFLQEARARGALPVGIEPDAKIASYSEDPVRVGTFPESLDDAERFDVIAFNDVLEHLPDAATVLVASREHLRPGGLLSVNIPTADGFGFRTACALARVGVDGPYRRLWQWGLGSPHRHYFSTRGLCQLIRGAGFEIRDVHSLPSISRQGLWARVHTIDRPSPSSLVSFAALYASSPLLNRRRWSDIVHVIAAAPEAART